jgi:hypothetical protein
MLETWRAQNTAPPYDVNRDALRQALQSEEDRVRKELRARRRGFWFCWILSGAMAIWAAFWIAITITNGWPFIYVITSVVSIGLFALGIGALWASRGPRPEPPRNFGHTLEEEVRRGLALVNFQLSAAMRWMLPMLGTVSIVAGTLLFSWTTMRSQNIPDSSSGVGGYWFMAVCAFLALRAIYKGRDARRQAQEKLELRQRRLRELLATLDAHQ